MVVSDTGPRRHAQMVDTPNIRQHSPADIVYVIMLYDVSKSVTLGIPPGPAYADAAVIKAVYLIMNYLDSRAFANQDADSLSKIMATITYRIIGEYDAPTGGQLATALPRAALVEYLYPSGSEILNGTTADLTINRIIGNLYTISSHMLYRTIDDGAPVCLGQFQYAGDKRHRLTDH